MSRRAPTSRRTSAAKLAVVALATAAILRPGAAPATVQEQRARLPPPAECSDPVAGIWRSHSYSERYRVWTIFTLDVRRVEGSSTELEGTIMNDQWEGDPEQSQPGACDGRMHFNISMDARGTVQNGSIVFSGHGQWRMDALLCGEYAYDGYNLDSFTGVIDPDLLEFQSVNNDGGRSVNVPVVFRRVQCEDGGHVEPPPQIAVRPPPFYPPEDERPAGCGCSGAGA